MRREKAKQLVRCPKPAAHPDSLVLSQNGSGVNKNSQFQLQWKGRDKHQSAVIQGDATRKRWHLTDRSLVVAAVRRNLSNISAGDLGAILMADLSRPAVIKGEHLLGATRVASFRNFHTYMENLVDAPFDEAGEIMVSIAVHSFSFWAAIEGPGCV